MKEEHNILFFVKEAKKFKDKKKLMIQIKQVTETFEDCSAYYDVILDKEYTVE